MINITGFSHLNIVVDSIEEAIEFYKNLLGSVCSIKFPHFKNIGFSKSAGFMNTPEEVELSIAFIEIKNTPIVLELMEYIYPKDNNELNFKQTNTLGFGHIALKTNNISQAFKEVRNTKEIKMISSHNLYMPYQLSNVSSKDFNFADENMENNNILKGETVQNLSKIKYFYFLDKYGVQWEIEES